MTVIVKIDNYDEWWTAGNLALIQAYAAKRSIDEGQLITYDQWNHLPSGLNSGSEMGPGIVLYIPMTPAALSNKEHQHSWRQRQKRPGYRELRVMVPNERYHEAKKYCEELE